jgi:hypothetical protein
VAAKSILASPAPFAVAQAKLPTRVVVFSPPSHLASAGLRQLRGGKQMREITADEKELFDCTGNDWNACTCLHCKINEECKYAFDLYNTDGDCLAAD